MSVHYSYNTSEGPHRKTEGPGLIAVRKVSSQSRARYLVTGLIGPGTSRNSISFSSCGKSIDSKLKMTLIRY